MAEMNDRIAEALALLIACEAKSKELHVQTKVDRLRLFEMGQEWMFAASEKLGMDFKEFIGMCFIVTGKYHGYVDDYEAGPPPIKWTE